LYFIQLPPPVHGVSTINEQVYNSEVINKGIVKSLLEIRFSNRLSQLRRLTIYKILHLIRLAFQLAGKLIRFRPDFVYFSIMPVGKGFWRDLIFVIIIKLTRTTPVYHLHNKGIEKKSRFLLMKWIYCFVFRNSMVINLSENLMQKEILNLRLKRIKTRVVPNGIKDDNIPENRGKTNRFNILYLSNLFPEKGFLELIEVFGRLAKENPIIYLDIIGGFPTQKIRQKIKKQITMSGFRERISLKGPRYGEEKRRIFGEADLFVFPSFFRQECFPLVILEAMQAGLPIITTREGAIPEIIDGGVNGIIINQKDNRALEYQIKRLINDSNLRLSLGKAARKKYNENFTLGHFEKNMRDFFEQDLIFSN
jgi:glycosyltransferase involved in cell wall biosynthesis